MVDGGGNLLLGIGSEDVIDHVHVRQDDKDTVLRGLVHFFPQHKGTELFLYRKLLLVDPQRLAAKLARPGKDQGFVFS